MALIKFTNLFSANQECLIVPASAKRLPFLAGKPLNVKIFTDFFEIESNTNLIQSGPGRSTSFYKYAGSRETVGKCDRGWCYCSKDFITIPVVGSAGVVKILWRLMLANIRKKLPGSTMGF